LNRTKRKALQLKVDTLPEDVRKRIVPVGGDMRVSSVKRRNLEFRECVSQPKAHDLTAISRKRFIRDEELLVEWDLHCQQIPRIVTRLDCPQSQEALDQQPCAHKQRQR
jgi:hypothetical protein